MSRVYNCVAHGLSQFSLSSSSPIFWFETNASQWLTEAVFANNIEAFSSQRKILLFLFYFILFTNQ